MSYAKDEEEGTCMSYEKEEEEDTCLRQQQETDYNKNCIMYIFNHV
jgi:hypothetical protein